MAILKTPTTLDYLILATLSEVSKNAAVRSKFLTEKINEKIMTTPIKQKAVTARLRVMVKGGFVEQKPSPYWILRDGYPVSYWKITNHGRSQFIPSDFLL